jgi:succinyl-CoA synthetase beta subunit
LLKDFGLNTVRGTPVTTAEEAEKIAKAYYAFAGTLLRHFPFAGYFIHWTDSFQYFNFVFVRVCALFYFLIAFAYVLDDADLVVKAQTLAGGRGKGVFDTGFRSGVHICTSAEEVREVSRQMLGHRLITAQTGKEGKPVNVVYICERRYIRREVYLGA